MEKESFNKLKTSRKEYSMIIREMKKDLGYFIIFMLICLIFVGISMWPLVLLFCYWFQDEKDKKRQYIIKILYKVSSTVAMIFMVMLILLLISFVGKYCFEFFA